jgi:hypothetical protein
MKIICQLTDGTSSSSAPSCTILSRNDVCAGLIAIRARRHRSMSLAYFLKDMVYPGVRNGYAMAKTTFGSHSGSHTRRQLIWKVTSDRRVNKKKETRRKHLAGKVNFWPYNILRPVLAISISKRSVILYLNSHPISN